jgi:hypothetical protein
MSEKTIIEINGIKMEIDLRHAVRIDKLQVGDRVKVLVKQYNDYAVYPGTIVGFEPFQQLPTIIVAYVVSNYGCTDVKFLYFNAQTKEKEIVKAIDDDGLDMDKAALLAAFDREVAKHEREIAAIEEKRAYFLNQFRAYWEPVAAESEEQPA